MYYNSHLHIIIIYTETIIRALCYVAQILKQWRQIEMTASKIKNVWYEGFKKHWQKTVKEQINNSK